MPANASQNGDGFRFYEWAPEGEEPVRVLSVTSIRTLAGQPFRLVAWKMAQLADAAMGTRKQTVIGPRGGVSEKRLIDEYPGEFLKQMVLAKGEQAKIDATRKWLMSSADEPRNTAAARGSIVHRGIELNVKTDQVDKNYVLARVRELSTADQKALRVDEQDVLFIWACTANYWDMREHVPFVIIAREPQVWNLTAGYAGSLDAFIWWLPKGTSATEVARLQKLADRNQITAKMIREYGDGSSTVSVGDWKTSKGIYTDHVSQVTAYLAGQFVGHDGVIDERLTAILKMASTGALIHIRPNGWEVDRFTMRKDVLYGFLGSCAFARFLAAYPEPDKLFDSVQKGRAELGLEVQDDSD